VKKRNQPWCVPKPCLNCEDIFNPNREHQRFCSTKCRIRYWHIVNKQVEEKFRGEVVKIKARLDRIEAKIGIGGQS
jgi:hypothetical protein